MQICKHVQELYFISIFSFQNLFKMIENLLYCSYVVRIKMKNII